MLQGLLPDTGAEGLLRTVLDGSVADWSIVPREVALVEFANLFNERGDHNAALRRADEAIARSRERGRRFELAAALYEKGNALRLTDASQSEHAYVESSEFLRGVLAAAKVQNGRRARIRQLYEATGQREKAAEYR